MPAKEDRVFIITLNGMLFTIDNGGNMAITTDNCATPLYEPDRSRSRFK